MPNTSIQNMKGAELYLVLGLAASVLTQKNNSYQLCDIFTAIPVSMEMLISLDYIDGVALKSLLAM